MPELKDVGRAGYDDVCGVIIGDVVVQWDLCYDGRVQSGYNHQTASNEDEAKELATALCRKLKAECKPIGLYPDDSKWELRVYCGKELSWGQD